ncbi:hypothetical protein BC940DRAFT_293065 [Gongronella butleri]|nr:hypothetical protein BC940DRAFT_293065 [Gongronella butleri]
MPSNAEHKQDTNEPAHTAFTNYRLLQVQDALREQVFVHDRQSFPDYRLNMCATSREHTKWYFVACTDFINVYEVCGTHLSREPAGVIRRCVMDGSIFNAIKVGHLTPEMEVLVGVGDYGEVVVWHVDKMDFKGTGAHSRQPQVLWYTINGDNISTWGIALHESGLLAVSANDHVIQVYNLAKTLNLPNITNALGDKDRIELIGHEHNVPTIDIDASGRFLASGSIDNSCRLWDLTTGKQVAQRTLGSGERQRRAW